MSGLLNSILDYLAQRECGTVTGITASPNSYIDKTVTFNRVFDAPPMVVACLQSGSTGSNVGQISVACNNITRTGFTVRVFNGSSNTRTPYVNWIALAV